LSYGPNGRDHPITRTAGLIKGRGVTQPRS
jgi:hypothetical protein